MLQLTQPWFKTQFIKSLPKIGSHFVCTRLTSSSRYMYSARLAKGLSYIDHKPVFHITGLHAFIGLIDSIYGDDFNI